ncbi:MAG: hypothetical protein J6U20_10080 [Fibrobacter sp.]|nr:hypothetical protein [Fibrobacter sp.]
MSGVYSKARERIAAMDALASAFAGAKAVADAERKRRNQRERSPERKEYKKAYDGVGGPGHEGMLERSSRYKERHPERCKAKQKRYYEEHREQEDERCRLWRRMKKILALATILTTCGDSARPCGT